MFLLRKLKEAFFGGHQNPNSDFHEPANCGEKTPKDDVLLRKSKSKSRQSLLLWIMVAALFIIIIVLPLLQRRRLHDKAFSVERKTKDHSDNLPEIPSFSKSVNQESLNNGRVNRNKSKRSNQHRKNSPRTDRKNKKKPQEEVKPPVGTHPNEPSLLYVEPKQENSANKKLEAERKSNKQQQMPTDKSDSEQKTIEQPRQHTAKSTSSETTKQQQQHVMPVVKRSIEEQSTNTSVRVSPDILGNYYFGGICLQLPSKDFMCLYSGYSNDYKGAWIRLFDQSMTAKGEGFTATSTNITASFIGRASLCLDGVCAPYHACNNEGGWCIPKTLFFARIGYNGNVTNFSQLSINKSVSDPSTSRFVVSPDGCSVHVAYAYDYSVVGYGVVSKLVGRSLYSNDTYVNKEFSLLNNTTSEEFSESIISHDWGFSSVFADRDYDTGSRRAFKREFDGNGNPKTDDAVFLTKTYDEIFLTEMNIFGDFTAAQPSFNRTVIFQTVFNNTMSCDDVTFDVFYGINDNKTIVSGAIIGKPTCRMNFDSVVLDFSEQNGSNKVAFGSGNWDWKAPVRAPAFFVSIVDIDGKVKISDIPISDGHICNDDSSTLMLFDIGNNRIGALWERRCDSSSIHSDWFGRVIEFNETAGSRIGKQFGIYCPMMAPVLWVEDVRKLDFTGGFGLTFTCADDYGKDAVYFSSSCPRIERNSFDMNTLEAQPVTKENLYVSSLWATDDLINFRINNASNVEFLKRVSGSNFVPVSIFTQQDVSNGDVAVRSKGFSDPDFTITVDDGSCETEVSLPMISFNVGLQTKALFILSSLLLLGFPLEIACVLTLSFWKCPKKFFSRLFGKDRRDEVTIESQLEEIKLGFQDIDRNDVKATKYLGGGASGKVFLAEWKGRNVACKQIELVTCDGQHDEKFKEFRREVEIMSSISNPRIVRFFGTYCVREQETYKVGIVMELAELGTLDNAIVRGKVLSWSMYRRVSVMLDVATGLRVLHEHGVFHRDVKPANVLLFPGTVESGDERREQVDEDGETFVRGKISDFGASRLAKNNQTSDNVGTIRYQAPEMVLGDQVEYNERCDSYSFGILSSELFFGKELFLDVQNPNAIPYLAKKGTLPKVEFPKNCPEEVVQIIDRCRVYENARRLNMQEIESALTSCKSSFFSDRKNMVRDESVKFEEMPYVVSNTGVQKLPEASPIAV